MPSSGRESVLKKLKENMEKIKEFGVRRIGIFGSYARGEQREESDVDIVVEFERGKATLDNFLGLADFLERLLGKKVDILTVEGIRSIRMKEVRKEIEESTVYVT